MGFNNNRNNNNKNNLKKIEKKTEKNCNLILNLGRSYLFNGKEEKKLKKRRKF